VLIVKMLLAVIIRIIWLVLELPHQRRALLQPCENRDQNSGRVWDAANLVETLGLVLAFWNVGHFELRYASIIGVCALIAGMVMRFAAIRTLGRFFASVVTIREDHEIIRKGLYGYVRHPAYTGALLAHAGLGLAFESWFSIIASTIPFWVAAVYRIHVEEKVLGEKFGADYANYVSETNRLIPGVY
jgi:protein-S-isoprenylcysteine O-methyltransferase Ste14